MLAENQLVSLPASFEKLASLRRVQLLGLRKKAYICRPFEIGAVAEVSGVFCFECVPLVKALTKSLGSYSGRGVAASKSN